MTVSSVRNGLNFPLLDSIMRADYLYPLVDQDGTSVGCGFGKVKILLLSHFWFLGHNPPEISPNSLLFYQGLMPLQVLTSYL